MKTFADKVITFNRSVDFTGALPAGIRIMNPFKEDKKVLTTAAKFYRKYYNNDHRRHLVLGINPGRFGAGLTGVPFTDPKRLHSECHIPFDGKQTHEPSSAFIYDMITAFGGTGKFYSKFYINSLCPLGFTSIGNTGKEINYNYYDSAALVKATQGFIVKNIYKQIALGVEKDLCFCFGTGKNEKFLRMLNEEHHFFDRIIALEHPRYIMQYKAKQKQFYIDKYLTAFEQVI